jgi:hypothetical protein
VDVGIAGQIDRPFLAQFRPSLTEVSHVAWRGAPQEMTGGTKGGEQKARTLNAYVRRDGSPVTATPIYHLPCLQPISIPKAYLSLYRPGQAQRFLEDESTRFLDNQHMKVKRLSVAQPATFSYQEMFKVPISGWKLWRLQIPWWGRKYYVNEKFKWHNRESNPRLSSF